MAVLARTVQRVEHDRSLRRFAPIALLVLLFTPMVSVQAQVVPQAAMGEIPEEILRQEMILDARSPLDGKPLTATEYAELQVEIDRLNEPTPTVSPKLQQLVLLVKLRKFLKTVLPIVPIK
jgi:hypothetical protein